MTNVLFMTTTPIPRTLAISVFGEMDVSSIKQLPKGASQLLQIGQSMNNMSKCIANDV